MSRLSRAKILTVPNVGQVDLIGAQDEAIYLEFSTRQIAALGLDQQAIVACLRAQNAITPSGVIEAGPERISVRVGGQFTSEESLRAINLRVNDRFFPLTDVATITPRLCRSAAALFRFNGQPGDRARHRHEAGRQPARVRRGAGKGDERDRGRPADRRRRASGLRPAGGRRGGGRRASPRRCSRRSPSCSRVSFVSLGLRAGLVVAIAIPLVLAITFLVMSISASRCSASRSAR